MSIDWFTDEYNSFMVQPPSKCKRLSGDTQEPNYTITELNDSVAVTLYYVQHFKICHKYHLYTNIYSLIIYTEYYKRLNDK